MAAELVTASRAGAEPLLVRADEWCPFNCEPGSPAPGYVVELTQEIFQRHGMSVDYRLMPWSRALAQAERGQIDAVIGANIAEAPNLIFPEESVGAPTTSFAVRRGEGFVYSGIADLEGRRIAVVQDYAYDNRGPIDRYIADMASTGSSSVTVISGDEVTKRLLRLLLGGRVDVAIEFGPVARYNRSQIDGGDTLEIIDLPPIAESRIYLGFSPKRPQARRLAALFTEGMREMRRSGRLAAILSGYGLTDWAPEGRPNASTRGEVATTRPSSGG